MRTLYLFRHAPADYLDGARCCLGSRTDPPVKEAGRRAAADLAPYLRTLSVASVWSSPMLRCRQTAEALAGALPVGIVPGLAEQDCGLWDGLGFDEIRARFPEEYARRGVDPALPPPGGEPPEQAAARGLRALSALMARTDGDVAAVAHAGLNRAVICALTGRPMAEMRAIPQAHLCMNVLRYDGGRFTVDVVGVQIHEGGYQ